VGEGGGRTGKQSRRNSIKIGEICIAPRNAGKRRDVVERLRGNRNLDAERRGKRGNAVRERGDPTSEQGETKEWGIERVPPARGRRGG